MRCFFNSVGVPPVLGVGFLITAPVLSNGVAITNPNPWPISLSWETPGSNFTKPALTSVAAWATATATATHSGVGGNVTVATTHNAWTLPNLTAEFAKSYDFDTGA